MADKVVKCKNCELDEICAPSYKGDGVGPCESYMKKSILERFRKWLRRYTRY